MQVVTRMSLSTVIGLLAVASARAGSPLAFTLPSTAGQTVRVAEGETKATVVWFVGTECPMAKLYAPKMSRLFEEFTDRGVQFVGVNSNRQDSLGDTLEYVQRHQLRFPVVQDTGNVVADRYEATRTTEVVLLDEELVVRYRGRIDDQYEPGISRSAPRRDDLRLAIEEVLSGKNVSVTETTPLGCLIGKVPSMGKGAVVQNDVTFANQVSRVLQRHCIECHRDGEIAPFAMQEYDEVAGWAAMMLETIENGRMPPWSADPEFGEFANARHMPDKDKQVLRDWIAGGLKPGDPADLPKPIEYVSGWQLPREPDLVLPMRNRPFTVRAEGTVDYQYFVVDPGFEEERWVSGAQIIPGAASVVHHAIAFIRPPDGVPMRGIGWLTAYVPGQRLVPLPPGHARKVPAGSKIVFQMHYTTNGRETDDVTQIGLLFADPGDVTHAAITLIGIDQEFEIPPHAENHEVRAEVDWFPKDGRLLGIAPHMHYRGKSFRLFVDQGERSTTLLSVPRYDFNWQHTYELAEPLPLADVDRLWFTAAFDNSGENPFNPDPKQWVTWGDQTWEEMAVAFFEVSEPLKRTGRPRFARTERRSDPDRLRKIEAYVARAFEKMDSNGDGRIEKAETPIVVRQFSFDEFDLDGDEVATREEIRQLAESLYR